MDILKITIAPYGDLFIIPYAPNNSGGDALEFFTDVLNSYTNEAEVRAQMRAIPREELIYPYGFQYEKMMGTFNAVTAGIRARWAIPLWFEAQQVTVATGVAAIALDTDYHDFRAGGLAMVYTTRGTWQVLKVATAVAGVLTLATAPTVGGKAFVMPVRLGWVSGQAAFKPTGYKNSTKLTYQVDDVRTGLTDAAPQYNGYDLYTDPYIIDGAGAGTVTRQDDQVEFSTGNIARSTPWKASEYGKMYGYVGTTPKELYDLKCFFYRRAGKFREFISPSFESNLRKASVGAVVSTFKIVDDGYASLMHHPGKLVGFGLDDGTWQIRAVNTVAVLGAGQSQLNLATPLNVDASRIRVVSYAGRNRLDTDRLEITLEPGGYSHAGFQVLELGA